MVGPTKAFAVMVPLAVTAVQVMVDAARVTAVASPMIEVFTLNYQSVLWHDTKVDMPPLDM
jgi:hypothetical protein